MSVNEQLYQKVQKLIKYASIKYSSIGHYALNSEDLEAEANLVFVEVCNKYTSEPEESLLKLFKTSMYNRFSKLLTKHRYTGKRTGESQVEYNFIDLSDILEVVGTDGFMDIYYQEYVAALKRMLEDYPDAAILFELCINPPLDIEELAENEQRRKHHLFVNQGIGIRGYKNVKVSPRHLAEYLNWDVSVVISNLKLLKSLALKIIYFDGTELA